MKAPEMPTSKELNELRNEAKRKFGDRNEIVELFPYLIKNIAFKDLQLFIEHTHVKGQVLWQSFFSQRCATNAPDNYNFVDYVKGKIIEIKQAIAK